MTQNNDESSRDAAVSAVVGEDSPTIENDAPARKAVVRDTRKKDNAPRGVFRHPSGAWAVRFACGLGHFHEEKVGSIKSDAVRIHAVRRQRVHDHPAWCPVVESRARREEAKRVEVTDRDAAARATTFAQYAETWWTATVRPHRKPRTIDYYQRMIDLHLKPVFGSEPLNALNTAGVRAIVAKKLSGQRCVKHETAVDGCKNCVAPLAKNTVKNVVATLRAILYQAQEDGLITSNPAARLGKLFSLRHDPRQHIAVLEPDGVARVLTAATKWYPDHELAVRVLFYTGMREGELLGLHWEDIDWQRNLIDLRRTVALRKGRLIVNTPKSGKLRTIDIPVSLTARLRERWSVRKAEAAVAGTPMSPWVFPALTDSTKPMNDAWLRDRVWRPMLEKAEVHHLRIHDARHTYASLMLRRGVPIAYVSKQLGHSSIQVTVDLYGHFVPGADRHHVEGLAAALETAGNPSATPHLDETWTSDEVRGERRDSRSQLID
jgi:integrase